MDTAMLVRHHPKAVFRELQTGGVLLHLSTGQYHGLNETGVAIWKLLTDGGGSVAQVAARLRELLDEPPAELEDVVADFLGALRERDLLVEVHQ